MAAARRATAVTAVCGHVRRIGGGNDTEAAVVAVAANGTARRREMAQRGSGEAGRREAVGGGGDGGDGGDGSGSTMLDG